MSDERLLTIKELKQLITKHDTGLLFCFGTSLISRIIQAKTKLNNKEVVPSHVAIIYQGKFLYESTSQAQEYKNKTIPAGVRRYLLTDFYNIEKDKGTKYYFFPCDIYEHELEYYVHYPYGKDLILDFLLTNGSDGVSDGLICSQYANKCSELMEMKCPSPAVLYRFVTNNVKEI